MSVFFVRPFFLENVFKQQCWRKLIPFSLTIYVLSLDFEQLEAEARMSQQMDNFAPLDDNSIQPTDDAGPPEVVTATNQVTEPPKPAEEPEKVKSYN